MSTFSNPAMAFVAEALNSYAECHAIQPQSDNIRALLDLGDGRGLVWYWIAAPIECRDQPELDEWDLQRLEFETSQLFESE